MGFRAFPADAEELTMYQLSVAALMLATLFAGAAMYITLVEHPARLELADGPLLAQWQPSYRRALPIQSGLAAAGGVAGLLVCYLSGDWRWAAGSVLLLANWPFTLLAIKLVNTRLMATTQLDAGKASSALLVRWGKLHSVRSAFGGGIADGDASLKEALGGEGADLAEMSSFGLPVPPGFTIGTVGSCAIPNAQSVLAAKGHCNKLTLCPLGSKLD